MANVDAEIRDKVAACEGCETKEEIQQLEAEIVVLKTKKEKLKEIQRDDREAKAKAKAVPRLTQETLNDQAGVIRDTIKRGKRARPIRWLGIRSAGGERPLFIDSEELLNEPLRGLKRINSGVQSLIQSLKEEEFDREEEDHTIETEAVEEHADGTARVFTGQAKRVARVK